MKRLAAASLKDFLEEKFFFYNNPKFVETDPVSIPHQFTKKEDIEIAGFLAATIAWGQRITILRNAGKLIHWMDLDPHQFILNFKATDLKPFRTFIHRTFQPEDCLYYMASLQNIYRNHEGLSNLFEPLASGKKHRVDAAIIHARQIFFELPHSKRIEKHFADPFAGSAAKRLNMFLRWMVRQDNAGVDFGIWNKISPSTLICPLDVHSGRVARKLGLLMRKQNDWNAAVELTNNLKKFDPVDPVKYDFALFGLGVFEKF